MNFQNLLQRENYIRSPFSCFLRRLNYSFSSFIITLSRSSVTFTSFFLPLSTSFVEQSQAGGLGINLTAADTVIIHDLDFNPENDRQAEDRSHRIGQTKEVTVYKLVTLDSVDEDIFEVGERKSQLTEAVLCDNNSKVGKKVSSSDQMGDIGSIGRILQKALQQHNTRNFPTEAVCYEVEATRVEMSFPTASASATDECENSGLKEVRPFGDEEHDASAYTKTKSSYSPSSGVVNLISP